MIKIKLFDECGIEDDLQEFLIEIKLLVNKSFLLISRLILTPIRDFVREILKQVLLVWEDMVVEKGE